ncbi:MAG: ribosome biogenesis GTPase Der, partial [Ignavibacteria bacterium]
YVVINKVDNADKESLSADFYELGFEKIYTISAQLGRKIGDFLDILTKDFPENVDLLDEKEETPKFAVVGKPNVGKSSFVNALLGYDKHIVTEIPGTTRDAIDTKIKYYGREITLIDTAGLRRRSRISESIEFFSVLRTLKALDRCNVVIILIDATQGIEKQDMRIINEAIKRKRGIIIAVNKWDLIEKDDKTARKFEIALKEILGEFNYIPIVFISALTKQRIYKVIEIALKILDEWYKKIPTSQINDFLERTFRAISLPSTPTGKEIKIKYGTQIKSGPPVFAFFANEPKDIQDHTKRFIENKLREEFGFVGVPLTLIFKRK